MVKIGGRHLGRARRYKRKNKTLAAATAEPKFWMSCNICGGAFVYANSDGDPDYVEKHTYMGKRFCSWCASRDAKKQIQYMVLVEKLAEQIPCLKHKDRMPYGEALRAAWEELRRNCKCLSCTARRVVQRDTAKSSS